MISFVGASSRGGFSTKAATRPSSSVGHDAEGGGVGHRVEGDGALGAARAVEGHESGQVEIGEDIAVDHDEGLVDAGERGGEPDGAGRVERLGLDGVRQAHAGDPAIGIGLHEGIGQVAEREDGLIDAVGGEVTEHTLDHGHPDDREHLLGGRERQRAEPRPLAAQRGQPLSLLGRRGGRRLRRRRGRRSDVVVVTGAVVVVVPTAPCVEVVPAAVVVVVATGA